MNLPWNLRIETQERGAGAQQTQSWEAGVLRLAHSVSLGKLPNFPELSFLICHMEIIVPVSQSHCKE